ncbi:hypothetical protein CC78DRAFT_61103 [Lojkania enalia]|uniref:Large ribosomal subunit protein mL67 n=1 Tax=Lojkania enalia TaxID=147567 RepID=A0A9P4KF61_9PLEO|nr:hypothetical protein CC78DRAFT_61103 [Didymosphaeria enalia]
MVRASRVARELRVAAQDRRAQKALVEHGKHIFMSRNLRTNQILYSFYPGLDKRHIKQLPFIGKHSSPPDIRRDLWTPYCTVTFPHPEQGHHAFRKLREFRKYHETRWDIQHPEWKGKQSKELVRSIIDQRANSVADLAKVLANQGEQGVKMEERSEQRKKEQEEFLEKQWAEIEELEKASRAEMPGLLQEISRMEDRIALVRGDKEETQRLRLEMWPFKRRRNKLNWAKDQLRQRKEAFELDAKEARKHEEAENVRKQQERALQTQRERFAEEEDVPLEDVQRSDDDQERHYRKMWKKIVGEQVEEMARTNRRMKEKILQEQREQLATQRCIPDEYIKFFEAEMAIKPKAITHMEILNESLLPKTLKTHPEPFKLNGVEIQWADLQFSEWAEAWPLEVVHDTMGIHDAKEAQMPEQETRSTPWISEEEYYNKLEEARETLRVDMEREARIAQGLPEDPAQAPPKTGIRRYMPEIYNPFKDLLKRASA